MTHASDEPYPDKLCVVCPNNDSTKLDGCKLGLIFTGDREMLPRILGE
jgi:hypothetical protein